MEFFTYLLNTYGRNEAILSGEISFNGYSASWLKKELQKLCKEGMILRFEKGVYYIPTDTPLGKSRLDPKKVIAKKYINNGSGTIGYFSGVTFMNMIGLSTQMPNVLEIYTNRESSKIREIPVGNQRVLLRRARTEINSGNAATMSFLELMNFTNSDFYDPEKRKILADYIKDNRITRDSIAKYILYFPDNAARTLVESEVIYDVAQ